MTLFFPRQSDSLTLESRWLSSSKSGASAPEAMIDMGRIGLRFGEPVKKDGAEDDTGPRWRAQSKAHENVRAGARGSRARSKAST